MRGTAIVFAFFAAIFVVSASATPTPHDFLLPFDVNGDGKMSRAELEAYFRETEHADPVDAANDVLTAFPGARESIAIEQAAALITLPSAPPPPPSPVGPCSYFGFERAIKDTPDPRTPETKVPMVFSYSRNEHAEDRDQLNVLGAVAFVDCAWHPGGGDLLNTTVGGVLGLDFEADGSAKAEDNTIAVSSPVFWRWVSPRAGAIVTGVNLTVTPSFGTDRAFDREVWEVAVKAGIRSPRFLRMGLISKIKDSRGDTLVSFWWQPTAHFATGSVQDAAGNADLEKLLGSYSHTAFRVDASLWPRVLSDRLAVKANFTERFNVDGGSRSFVEAQTTYDITESGSVAFTAIYRHGRRAPDFSAKDQWLVGIGIQR